MFDRRFSSDRGASAVELALVLGLLLMLVFGITQFGLAYHAYEGAQAAAREGARIAALPSTSGGEVRARVAQSLPLAGPVAACPPGPGEHCVVLLPDVARPCADRSGETVTVEVRRGLQLQVPLWASPEIVVGGKGVFRCE